MAIQAPIRPHVIIKLGSSLSSYQTTTPGCAFGNVEMVYAGCDKFGVDMNVFFDTTKGSQFSDGTDTFYVVEDKYVMFTEQSAP